MVRHTNKILDGSIIPGNPDITSGEDGQGTFREILQLVQGLHSTITEQFGVTPTEKNRDVNDHLGILNNMFTATEDSSRAVFTSMKEAITFINTGALAQDTAYQTALNNLKKMSYEASYSTSHRLLVRRHQKGKGSKLVFEDTTLV